MPREMLSAPLTLPLAWTSDASRTSTTRAFSSETNRLASSDVTLDTAAFAAVIISFTLIAMSVLHAWTSPIDVAWRSRGATEARCSRTREAIGRRRLRSRRTIQKSHKIDYGTGADLRRLAAIPHAIHRAPKCCARGSV